MRAILACDNAGGIGLNGSLPWPKISEDLKRFRRLTSGGTVIMGRNTWEAPDMPHPLPNRLNVVVSTQRLNLPSNVIHLTNIDHLDRFKGAWIIGGAKLLQDTLPLIKELHLSRVPGTFNCDTFIDLAYITGLFTLTHQTVYNDHTYEIWQR